MSSRYSRGSEDWILGLNGPECESLDSAKLTGRPDESLNDTGRESRSRTMSEQSALNGSEVWGWSDEMLDRPRKNEIGTIRIGTTIGGPTPSIVSILSAEVSRVKTSPSPADAPDSPAKDPDSFSRPPESLTLFSTPEDGSSLRTYPDSFPQMEELTSGSFSRRWPTSGFMTAPGECWTADTSECPNGGGVFSSLPDVLEGTVPKRFFLSQKAAAGILRRAKRRGKSLPAALDRALRVLSGHTSPGDGEERNLTDMERMSA